MENQKEHHELMTKLGNVVTELAVLKTFQESEFKHITDHLQQLNHKTSKNTGAIEQLQEQDRNILSMVSNQQNQDKAFNERQEARDKKSDSWRNRWMDLLFGNLNWLLPAVVVGILWYGRDIVQFFSAGK